MNHIRLPFDIMFKEDWHGWLAERKVPGDYNMNSINIYFDDRQDMLAFKLAFGVERFANDSGNNWF